MNICFIRLTTPANIGYHLDNKKDFLSLAFEYGIYSSLIFDHAPGTNPFSVLAEFKKSLSDMCRIFVECILYRYDAIWLFLANQVFLAL